MDARTLALAYDRSAADYDEQFRELQRTKYRAVFRVLPELEPGALVLDAGAGTGLLAEWLHAPELRHATWATALRIVALDRSRRMLAQAARRGLVTLAGDLMAPPVKRAFDVAFAFTSLVGADTVTPGLAALRDTVKPGGVVAATVLRADVPSAVDLPGLQRIAWSLEAGQDLAFVWRVTR